LPGRNWLRVSRPAAVYPALTSVPVPDGDPAAQLAAHAFLALDAESARFTIRPGRWDVQESIVIPAGYRLVASAGTTLTFADTAALVSHGPVELIGSADAPVILQARSGQSWPGMTVLDAGQPSLLERVIVRDTHALTMGDWVLTGGVNFYASPVKLLDCELRDSHGEDALNIIHSRFDISRLLIDGTASDAFDADFSTGTITDSRFEHIGIAGGGDGIDVSGSQVAVSRINFDDVSDKALSVGERSEITARDIRVQGTGTGAAAKDGSMLLLSDAQISDAQFAGLAAYTKKAEHGPAEIVAENVAISGAGERAIAQKGSRISIDGKAVESRDLDVDALYETVMRKGLK
jgi:hypothetical protein